MAVRVGWLPYALLLALVVACTTSGAPEAPAPLPTAFSATPTALAGTPTALAGTPTALAGTPTASAGTPTASASPALRPVPTDIRASRLAIPALNIDERVQSSQIVPDTSTPRAGCPPRPPGEETFTVPERGIATPERALEALPNRSWIFGHSRWENQPGVFFRLQDISVGDELFVDGIDRPSGEQITRRRFVVGGIYLTDIDSGGTLVAGSGPAGSPAGPVVILQTSAREDGPDRPWLLDRQKVVAKSRNLIEGDVNDPCKYLLLFVFARAS